MDTNWYVIQVKSRREDIVMKECRLLISNDILIDCFVPKYRHLKRYQGKWHQVEDILFTGYVFLISDRIEELFHELSRIPELTKLLGNDGDNIYPLTKKDIVFLEKFINDDYLLDMSTGYIEGDKVVIRDGPLVGYEGFITKIDRHKRIAYLDLFLFDQQLSTKVGLEIISKR